MMAASAADREELGVWLLKQGSTTLANTIRTIIDERDAALRDARMLRETVIGAGWQEMNTAPKDGTNIILLTSDFGPVDGRWRADVPDFYAEMKGEPDLGEWVSGWNVGGDADPHGRLFCGMTPVAWMPKPEVPKWADPWGFNEWSLDDP